MRLSVESMGLSDCLSTSNKYWDKRSIVLLSTTFVVIVVVAVRCIVPDVLEFDAVADDEDDDDDEDEDDEEDDDDDDVV